MFMLFKIFGVVCLTFAALALFTALGIGLATAATGTAYVSSLGGTIFALFCTIVILTFIGFAALSFYDSEKDHYDS